ncbi:MAG TPA: hypothetical protein VLV76_11465 [Candidatus Acidoferrum sp.]|nr:hypothetical protein [Candidatus Acidoferrum sp.]
MFRLAFLMAILIFGLAMSALTAGVSSSNPDSAAIDTVRGTPMARVAHTGLSDDETVDAWIEREFYLGRFDVSWSAEDIAEGANAGKVRVTADMRSYSQERLERSILLRFDIDPKDNKVTFAGMVLEGADVASASGKPYSLEEAMTRMWERRRKIYLPDDYPDNDS